jgi:hypothetical protein
LRAGLANLGDSFEAEAAAEYEKQLVLHCIILAVMLLGAWLYLWLLFKPFLQHSLTGVALVDLDRVYGLQVISHNPECSSSSG